MSFSFLKSIGEVVSLALFVRPTDGLAVGKVWRMQLTPAGNSWIPSEVSTRNYLFGCKVARILNTYIEGIVLMLYTIALLSFSFQIRLVPRNLTIW